MEEKIVEPIEPQGYSQEDAEFDQERFGEHISQYDWLPNRGGKSNPELNRFDSTLASYFSEDPIAFKNQVMDEYYTNFSFSPTHQELKDGLLGYEARANEQALDAVLIDPNVPDNIKKTLLQAHNDGVLNQDSMENLVAKYALAEPLEGETPSMAEDRKSILDTIESSRELSEKKQAVQNMVALAHKDDATAKKVVNFLEFLIPFLGQGASIAELKDFTGLETNTILENPYILSGEAVVRMREHFLEELSEQERKDLVDKFLSSMGELSGSVIMDSNNMDRMRVINYLLEDEYPTWERVVDNIASVLDLTFVLAPLARAMGVGKGLFKEAKSSTNPPPINYVDRPAPRLDDSFELRWEVDLGERGLMQSEIDRAVVDSITGTGTIPNSLGDILRQTNHDQYKMLYSRALADDSGELAMEVFGKSLEDLKAYGEMPKPLDTAGEYVNMPNQIGAARNREIRELAENVDGIHLTDAERELGKRNIEGHIEAVNGFSHSPASSQVTFKGDSATSNKVVVRAVYKAADESLLTNPASHVDSLARELAHLGVDKTDIKILSVGKDGTLKETVTMKTLKDGSQVAVPGNPKKGALVVNFEREIDIASSLTEKLDPKYTFFNRFKSVFDNTQYTGTVTSNLLNPKSIFPKYFSFGAMRATDKSSRLSKLLSEKAEIVTKTFNKLPLEEKVAVTEYIKKANYNRTPYNYNKARAEGFSEEAIETLKSFRDVSDSVYYLDNLDNIKILRNEGYWKFTSSDGNTEMFLKPIDEAAFQGKGKQVYNPHTNEVEKLSASDIADIYKSGGKLANPKTASNIAEDAVIGGPNGMPVVVRADGNNSFRALKDSDQVLPYIEGYYRVKYDAPYFIYKNVVQDGGEVSRQVIGVAGTKGEALKAVDNLKASDVKNAEAYSYKLDDTEYSRVSTGLDLEFQAGRSSQRIRGARLSDMSTDSKVAWDNQYVEHPLNSMLSSAAGAANKIAMRDWLDTARHRFLRDFGHLLEEGAGVYGNKVWPTSGNQIGSGGKSVSSKEVGQARQAFEYITAMERGYLDAIDEGWRNTWNAIGNMVGGPAETVARGVAKVGPQRAAKKTSTEAYIILNPARQSVLQVHQAVQLFARYGSDTPAALNDTIFILADLANIKGIPKVESARIKDMADGFMKSGLPTSVTRHSLLRDSMLLEADFGLAGVKEYTTGVGKALSNTKRAYGHLSSFSSKIGFEAGEVTNLATAYAAAYRRMSKEVGGRNLTNAEKEIVAAEVRSFTLGMNKADDFAYTNTGLKLVLQYMQVPHKAATQMVFDRTLTKVEKTKLAAFNLGMYGIPPSAIGYVSLASQMEEMNVPVEYQDAILFGLEEKAFNMAMTALSGEKTNIRFTSISPVDNAGLVEAFEALYTMSPTSLFQNSAFGSLLYGAAPRVTTALRTVDQWWNPDPELMVKPEFQAVINRFAEFSSGYSNYRKTKMAFEYGNLHSLHSGNIQDYELSTPEKVALFFGMTTQEAFLNRITRERLRSTKEDFEADVKTNYSLMKSILIANHGNPERASQELMALSPFLADVKEDNPVAYAKRFSELAASDMTKTKYDIYTELVQAAGGGYIDKDGWNAAIVAAPKDIQEELRELIRSMEEAEESIIEYKKRGK